MSEGMSDYIEKMLGTNSAAGHTRIGKYLGVRKVGETGHIQLTSFGGASPGMDEVIIHKEDFGVFGDFLKRLTGEGLNDVLGIEESYTGVTKGGKGRASRSGG